MNATTIADTTRLWRAEPDKAKGRPTVTARTEGAQAVLEAGSFTWTSDLPTPLGGSNAAPSPTAYLLGALAGCAVVFIRDTLAPQLGLRVDAVHAVARCEADSRGLLGLDGIAPDLSRVAVEITVDSPEPEERLAELFAVWQARCPVYLALTKPLDVRATLDARQPVA